MSTGYIMGHGGGGGMCLLESSSQIRNKRDWMRKRERETEIERGRGDEEREPREQYYPSYSDKLKRSFEGLHQSIRMGVRATIPCISPLWTIFLSNGQYMPGSGFYGYDLSDMIYRI